MDKSNSNRMSSELNQWGNTESLEPPKNQKGIQMTFREWKDSVSSTKTSAGRVIQQQAEGRTEVVRNDSSSLKSMRTRTHEAMVRFLQALIRMTIVHFGRLGE